MRGMIVFTPDRSRFDTVYGFEPGRDVLAFAPGFLARLPPHAPGTTVLRVCSGDRSRALLAANTARSGWRFLAEFVGVECGALTRAIEDGTIPRLRADASRGPSANFAAAQRGEAEQADAEQREGRGFGNAEARQLGDDG